MTKYSFILTPGYCLYNGVAVKNQKGAKVSFLIENPENDELKNRLGRAFRNHVDYVRKQSDCPENYKENFLIEYEKCNRTELKKAVSNLYKKNSAGFSFVAEDSEVYNGAQKKDEEDFSEDSAAILLLDSILNDARAKGVSDIHIEQNDVRFRIKGKLVLQMSLSEARCLEVVQRIKLLSGMNVIENRRSQDGRFIFNLRNPLFVRASSIPVVSKTANFYGESIVLRLLDPVRVPLDFLQLGFNSRQIERIKLLESEKDGLLLICGPTGSGKSTTAATLVKDINKGSKGQKKIISLEDPPEFVIPGVTQIFVDKNHENTFENLLNHIFRQDPDVIMIGEIRDEISAAAALRASLTGHLVIATLHTSSAYGALLRLENLGVKRSLLVSVLRGVIVQELECFGDELVLAADVCFPCCDFCEKVRNDSSQKAIEELFDAESNGGEVLAKSLEVMKKKQLAVEEVLESVDVEENDVFSRKKRKHPLFMTGNGEPNSGEVEQNA